MFEVRSFDVLERSGQGRFELSHDVIDLFTLLVDQFLAEVVSEFRFFTFSIKELSDFLGMDCIDSGASKALGFSGGFLMFFDLGERLGVDLDGHQLCNSIVGLNDEWTIHDSVNENHNDFSIVSGINNSSFDG